MGLNEALKLSNFKLLFDRTSTEYYSEFETAFRAYAVLANRADLGVNFLKIKRAMALGRRWQVMWLMQGRSFHYHLASRGWKLTLHGVARNGDISKQRLVANMGSSSGYDVEYDGFSFRGSWEAFQRDMVLIKLSGLIDITYQQRDR